MSWELRKATTDMLQKLHKLALIRIIQTARVKQYTRPEVNSLLVHQLQHCEP